MIIKNEATVVEQYNNLWCVCKGILNPVTLSTQKFTIIGQVDNSFYKILPQVNIYIIIILYIFKMYLQFVILNLGLIPQERG